MPQQVLNSSPAPEGVFEPRPQRERELRVQGDARAFGMLLGALQAGEAGIVRGEARDDSAAEWNAQAARSDDRQARRDPAQASTQRAQEPRDPLAPLSTRGEPAKDMPTPTSQARSDAAEPPTRGPEPSNKGSQASGHQGTQKAAADAEVAASQTRQNQSMQPNAAVAAASKAGAAVAGSASAAPSASTPPTQAQGNAVTAAANARGPQGDATRGKTPTQTPTPGDRNLRFERVFEAQVGRGLAKALQSSDGAVTLRLKPQSLGQLSVRVHVRESQVTATFEARTAEAVRLLDASRETLRHQLEARGLSVERIDVRLIEEPQGAGTRIAFGEHGGADGGQGGQGVARDGSGRGSPDAGARERSRGGAPREDDEPSAGAEPWRVLGTVRLDAIA